MKYPLSSFSCMLNYWKILNRELKSANQNFVFSVVLEEHHLYSST